MPKRPATYQPSKPKAVGQMQRGTSCQRGYDRQWRKARAQYLSEHPLCVDCDRQGRVIEATIVDHKTPHRGDLELFWDVTNWQPLCKSCHDTKTARGG